MYKLLNKTLQEFYNQLTAEEAENLQLLKHAKDEGHECNSATVVALKDVGKGYRLLREFITNVVYDKLSHLNSRKNVDEHEKMDGVISFVK